MTIGREYLRVSVDKSGRERSNEQQHAENVDAAPGLGIDKLHAKPYRDTVGASRQSRKKRDDFPVLLDDLAHGRFGADVLVLWESSRGSRRVSEWVELLELCEETNVKIAVTTHGRVYDPANPRDRKQLIEDANDSEYESAKISLRGRRHAAANAGAGRPHGRIPFGYRRVYDATTRQLVRQEADPDEAPVVVEAFKRFAGGHSLTAICKDFAARGITNRRGVPFTPNSLRAMLLRDCYRGKRVHTSSQRGSRRNTHDATWPALVDDAVFLAVRARLTDPARLTRRPGRATHLLSMTARCDNCKGPMTGCYSYGPRKYRCHDAGHTVIDADRLDAWAESRLLDVLTRPDVVEKLMPEPVDPVALRAARDEVALTRAEHDDLGAQVAAGKLTASLAAKAEPGILARLEAAEQRVKDFTAPVGLRQLIDPGPQAVAQWNAAPIEVKRDVVRLLFAERLLGVLSVAGVNGTNTIEARVRLDGKPLSAKAPVSKKKGQSKRASR